MLAQPKRSNLTHGNQAIWDPHFGQARLASAGPARPAVHLDLPVRRYLSGARHWRRPVMPEVSIDALNNHLAEISQCVSTSAIVLLILDGVGWHSSPPLVVPENIVLLPLPPYAPELNPTENIWDYLRSNFLSHCVLDTYEAIFNACCDAWNALIAKPEVINSIGTRSWVQIKI